MSVLESIEKVMSTALLDASDLGLGLGGGPVKPIGEFNVTAIESDGHGNVGVVLGGDGAAAVATERPVIATAVATSTPTTTRRRSSKAASAAAGQSTTATTTPSTQRGLFFFDLETIPDYERMELFDLEAIPDPTPRTTVEAMGNDLPSVLLKKTLDDIKDTLATKAPCEEYLVALEQAERSAQKPRKGVFDAIAKVRSMDDARLEALAAQRKAMATCPEMCKIVAFGWKTAGDKETQSMVVGVDGVTEEAILEKFWELVPGATKTIGFNILGFDLLVIFLRSILLGISPTRVFDLKPWGTDCIDLMAVRFPKGPAPKGHGLKWLAKSMSIPIPAGDVDGSQVEALYNEDPAKVGLYVKSDVDLAIEIYSRYLGFFFR